MQNQDRERSEPVDYNITASLARSIPLRDPSNKLRTDVLSAMRWVMEGMRTLSPKVFLNSCTFAIWAHEDAQKMSTVSQLPVWDKIDQVTEDYLAFQISRLLVSYNRKTVDGMMKANRIRQDVLRKHDKWKVLSKPVLWSADRKGLIVWQYYKVEMYSPRGKFKFPHYAVEDAARMAQATYNVNGEGHLVRPTADVPWVLDRWVVDQDDVFNFHPQHQDLTDLRNTGYTIMPDFLNDWSVQLEIEFRRAFCALPINHP